MSLFRLLSEKLQPGLLSAEALVDGLKSLHQPSQLQMRNTEFSSWTVHADRRSEERRKNNLPVYLDTRCIRDRRNSRGRRWPDKHGQPARGGVDIYV